MLSNPIDQIHSRDPSGMECVYANADRFLNTNGIGQLHLAALGKTIPFLSFPLTPHLSQRTQQSRNGKERKTAFTPKIAAALLAGGRAKVKRLYSPKTGKTYDGSIVLADTGGKYVNYRIELARDKELTQQA